MNTSETDLLVLFIIIYEYMTDCPPGTGRLIKENQNELRRDVILHMRNLSYKTYSILVTQYIYSTVEKCNFVNNYIICT